MSMAEGDVSLINKFPTYGVAGRRSIDRMRDMHISRRAIDTLYAGAVIKWRFLS